MSAAEEARRLLANDIAWDDDVISRILLAERDALAAENKILRDVVARAHRAADTFGACIEGGAQRALRAADVLVSGRPRQQEHRMSAAEEPNVLNDPNAVADALTEVADWHCVECIDMHGEADEDGPGAGCCFHAKAAYRTNEAAVMLRRLLAERDALAARVAELEGAIEMHRWRMRHLETPPQADELLAARLDSILDAIGDPDELRWHRWHCEATGSGDDLRELLVRIADAASPDTDRSADG